MGGRRYPPGTTIPVNGVVGDLAVDSMGRLMVSDVVADGAAVANGSVVPVRNSANADSHNGTADTTSGSVVVKLAATVAMVDNGDALVIPVTGVYATTATISVANGVPTAIVLS